VSKITVYRFTKYDITTDQYQQSRRWATREAIERICGHAHLAFQCFRILSTLRHVRLLPSVH